MLYVTAVKRVKKENHAKFLEIASELVDCSRKEDGCYEYTLTASQEDENILVYVEKWESRDHLKAHTQTEHYQRIMPLLNVLCYDKDMVLKLTDAYL